MTDILLFIACGLYLFVIVVWLKRHPLISAARRRACRGIAAGEPDHDQSSDLPKILRGARNVERCHSERSEEPARERGKMLRFAQHDVQPLPLPLVSVVVPAKDEQENLANCLGSVLTQRAVHLEVIVVDDRSTDQTGRIADDFARRDQRVRVLHNVTLPAGWMGKSHACWLAAAQATGDWLLFLDADCQLQPTALASAVAYAHRAELDVFSLWPRDGSVGFWERLLIPLCGAMIVLWYGNGAAQPTAGGRVFANGQFLLVRRAAYDAVGGHRRVRAALIEDIPLATAAAEHGQRVGSALGADLVTVRMYRSFQQVVRGWRRIYLGVLRPWQVAGCIVSLLVASLLPMLLAPLCLYALLTGYPGVWAWTWLVLAVIHLAALLSVSVRFFGLARCRRRYLWLYPLSVVGVIGVLLSTLSAQIGSARVGWRGTDYEVNQSGTVKRHTG